MSKKSVAQAASILAFLILVSCEKKASKDMEQTPSTKDTKIDLSVNKKGLSNAVATIHTKKGAIKFKFYPQDAPKTVDRIIKLIQSGFYNGLTFHRVVPGFVIQGGDPKGDGTGGSGTKLKAEFNKRQHFKGTLAMARARDPDSADSQFYICLDRQHHLDSQYTVFGQVVEGQEIADKIAAGDVMEKITIQ